MGMAVLITAPLYIIFIWALIIVLLVILPEQLQPFLVYLHWVRFPLGKLDKGERFGFRARTVRNVAIKTADGIVLAAWHILPRSAGEKISTRAKDHQPERDIDDHFDDLMSKCKTCFIYFHGNAANRAAPNRVSFYREVLQRADGEAHIIALDYRGFGDSCGARPSERGLQLDAQAVWEWVVRRVSPNAKVYLVGHSLGTGVATYLAAHLMAEAESNRSRTADGLILVAPYKSVPDAALTYPTVPLLMPFRAHPAVSALACRCVGEKWDSMENIKALSPMPILILHGAKDWEIPPSHSAALFESACIYRSPSSARLHSIQEPIRGAPASSPPRKRRNSLFSAMKISTEGTLHVSTDNKVWYLEVARATHNNVGYFDIVPETLTTWLQVSSE
ncbi:hypothetical protein SeMB42_g00998 [Synchytrium endobioticum]|uniref:AB hydrolase-1 domain-containing protein n=1 Tax=Synchytrium endobioticum TaxID=286115 RepID=A0A507DQK1_9FUNG|nr:hypothetical protein SeMB42_g00998 [Synchytrium endobioticum]